MTYHPDPGGIFDSDTHRRVLGHLPPPGEEPMAAFNDTETSPRVLRRVSLLHRMQPDTGTDLADADELEAVLADLEADGDAAQNDLGWVMTQAGFDKLTGPNKET